MIHFFSCLYTNMGLWKLIALQDEYILNHERSKDVLVIVCFCSLFIVFMGFCFSRPAWPFCTQAQMS